MRKYQTEQHDLQNEEWRDLFNYQQTNGIYYISNYGRYKRRLKNGSFYYSFGAKCQGYLQLDIRINNKRVALKKMHDLIFEAFYRKLQPNEIVHHLNQKKNCNNITNLVAWDEVYHLQYHNIGKTASVQTRLKRSKSLKGIKRGEQWKNNISNAHKGKIRSEQQKKKISASMKEVWRKRKHINNNKLKQEVVK